MSESKKKPTFAKGDKDYPDTIVPFAPPGFAKLQPINGMRCIAPKISWGGEYDAWPIEKRLRYAERLASAMNHAADLLQQERNKLLEIAQHHEVQLKAAIHRYNEASDLLQRQVTLHNAEEQKLHRTIVELQGRIRALEKANDNLSQSRTDGD
jgi:hypothetical protein